ncbi:hypothetical protein BC941DRAFT_262675 [Chlamydoabsidia padenii]|nr:hypothetical protein BC941DRAFT_262675 [Chlamydoabsidia padenii]
MNSNGRIAKTNQNSALILDNNHLPASPIPNRLPRTDSASIRDSGNSVNTDNSNRKDRPSPVQKVPSFTSYMTTTTPVPPRTTSSSPIEHPAPAHTQKQPISQHYYPQQQHPKHHEYTIPQNQPSYELPLEDSFFHPDNSSDKNKPASSSSCCCIIS